MAPLKQDFAYVPSHFSSKSPKCEMCLPEIVIFHELLIVETHHKCHWIQHALNPKYAPLKQFWCIFAVKINKMWFLPEIVIFQEPLSQRLEICSIRFSMPQTLNMWHSSHFDAFFPVKSNKMWNFGCFLNSPWQKTEKMSICTGKKFLQRLANLHIQVFGYADHNALC